MNLTALQNNTRQSCALTLIAMLPSLAQSAEDGHHSHHLAASVTLARHGGKTSSGIGVDYAYVFESGFAIAGYFEDVRGDFDVQAYGLAFGRFFDNGFKASTGPGIETKLKSNKNLFLWHLTAGYDWHSGNWSYGPIVTYDFISDASNTVYLGFGIGYGF